MVTHCITKLPETEDKDQHISNVDKAGSDLSNDSLFPSHGRDFCSEHIKFSNTREQWTSEDGLFFSAGVKLFPQTIENNWQELKEGKAQDSKPT